jgi:hypothetical protein
VTRLHVLRLLRIAALVTVLAALYAAGSLAEDIVRGFLGPAEHMWTEPRVWIAALAFIILLAIPYVPGMEVSVALLIILGAPGAVLVYCATLVALSLSYGAGRKIPTEVLADWLGWLHLHGARDLVLRIHPLPPQEKLAALTEQAPARWIPYLLRHRYVALALLLNLPGNSLLGGGGGIGLFAGTSGLFRFPAYALTITIAALPIPLVVSFVSPKRFDAT